MEKSSEARFTGGWATASLPSEASAAASAMRYSPAGLFTPGTMGCISSFSWHS